MSIRPEATAVETTALRRQRLLWLGSLGAAARGRQRWAAACICVSGALLIGQAAAIAWLIQAVLVEHRPLASATPVLVGLLGVLTVRALL
ncbi:MAG: hypothetical protein ACK40L_16540, partial [Hydrogenophaga sp.]